MKHLLNHHEGEARFVGDSRWELFPASGGGEPWNACYWSYQFVGTNETRKYLYERSQEEWSHEDLIQDEISWIMAVTLCGCLWLSVVLRGCLWLSVAVCGCLSLSVVVRGCLWLSVAVCGCVGLSVAISVCLWLSVAVCGLM